LDISGGSGMSQIDPKIELLMQKGIRQAEDELVQWIEDALDPNTTTYGRTGKDKLEDAQFRNLVRVADTTESPEVIKNFLRYQVGRDSKWGRGDNSLATRIVQDIDSNLKLKSDAIAKDSGYPSPKEIQIELIRRYLGYGARCLKYLNLPKNPA
jgi:hypothetical protein